MGHFKANVHKWGYATDNLCSYGGIGTMEHVLEYPNCIDELFIQSESAAWPNTGQASDCRTRGLERRRRNAAESDLLLSVFLFKNPRVTLNFKINKSKP